MVKLSDEDIAKIECLRVVTMETNFGTKIAISWLYVNCCGDAALCQVTLTTFIFGDRL